MKKTLKITMTFSIALVLFLVGGIVVNAAGQNYPTYMSISTHSSLTGQERTFAYDYYRTDITPSYLEEGSSNPGQVSMLVELIRPLYRLGIKYGQEVKYEQRHYFNVSAVGVTKQIYMGNCGDGKRYLFFSTADGYGGTGALKGDVNIYNYQ